LRRAGTALPLPRSQRSNKRGSRSWKNPTSRSTTTAVKVPHLGKRLTRGDLPAVARSLPRPCCPLLGLQRWVHAPNLLCRICFMALTPSTENINLILFKPFFCPELTKTHALVFKCDIGGCLKGRTEDGAAEPTYFNKKTSWSCWVF